MPFVVRSLSKNSVQKVTKKTLTSLCTHTVVFDASFVSCAMRAACVSSTPARGSVRGGRLRRHHRGGKAQPRAWWDRFGRGGADARSGDDAVVDVDVAKGGAAVATATTTKKKTEIKAEDALASLSAVLGVDEEAEREKREQDEADARRAEAQKRERASREERMAREKAFAKADAATTRIQRLQAVFLDVPLGVMDFMSGKDSTPGGEDLGEEPAWFKLPMEVFDKVTGERFVLLDENDKDDFFKVQKSDEEIVRQPGEFQVPVIPYPFVATPGSYVRLNLFEPRWLTLFSKLIPSKDEVKEGENAAGATDEEGFRKRRVLRGLDGRQKIDLNDLQIIDAYEKGERTFDIVPGFGRLPEDDFVNTNAFGAVFRGLDGQIAGVGTMMEVQSHDVVVDGRLLAVCAKGKRRFKILRVAQTEPYIIVDAVPIEDDESTSTSANEAMDVENAEKVNEVFELMNKVDPYYMEAIGLTDVSKKDVQGMNEFDLANVMLYTHPTLALKLLASTDAAKRKRVIQATAKNFKRAIELGFTSRKSRLLFSAVNFSTVFAVGFLILAIKNALDGDSSGLDNFNF